MIIDDHRKVPIAAMIVAATTIAIGCSSINEALNPSRVFFQEVDQRIAIGCSSINEALKARQPNPRSSPPGNRAG